MSTPADQVAELAADGTPKRLTLSRIVELQYGLLSRANRERSSVILTRNAKGDVQIEVTVRTGDGDIETVDECEAKARQVFDQLAAAYPRVPDGAA